MTSTLTTTSTTMNRAPTTITTRRKESLTPSQVIRKEKMEDVFVMHFTNTFNGTDYDSLINEQWNNELYAFVIDLSGTNDCKYKQVEQEKGVENVQNNGQDATSAIIEISGSPDSLRVNIMTVEDNVNTPGPYLHVFNLNKKNTSQKLFIRANGGNGKASGNGGNGASLTVNTEDSRLLNLIVCDVSGGKSGNNISEENISDSGKNECKDLAPSAEQFIEVTGRDNKKEMTLPKYGKDGKDGFVTYNIIDKEGQTIECALTMYNLKILSFDVRPKKNNDVVIEPGEILIFENIKISNDGGLVLPYGAQLVYKNTEYVQCDDVLILPEIAPYSTYTTPKSMEVYVREKIKDGWKKENKISIEIHIELLGRILPRSWINVTIPILFAVQLEASAPAKVGCGSEFKINVKLSNPISKRSIKQDFNIQVRFLHQEFKKRINCVEPGETIQFDVDLHLDFYVNFYERYPWKTSLFNGSQLVQEIEGNIQAVPSINFDLIDSTDVLMIVVTKMSRNGYKILNSMFQLLGLKVQWWDSHLYHGVSWNKKTGRPHFPTWVDKYREKLIIIAVPDTDKLMEEVKAMHIISHFIQENNDSISSMESSGLLLILSDTQGISSIPLEEAKRHDRAKLIHYLTKMEESTQYNERQLDPVTEFRASFRFMDPNEEHVEERCREIEQQYEQMHPCNRYKVKVEHIEIKEITDRKLASWYKMNWKYTLGQASLYRAPITTLQHLLGVRIDDNVLNSKKYEEFSKLIMSSDFNKFINTDSPYFKIFYSTINGLSIHKRLELIRDNSQKMGRTADADIDSILNEINPEESYQFNQYRLLNYMIRETIFQDLKRELKFQENSFFRIEKLCSIILNDEAQELIHNREVIAAVIFIFCRLEKISYWRTWVPGMLNSILESMKEKYEKLEHFKTKCFSALEAGLSSGISQGALYTFEEVLNEARAEAENRYAEATVEMDDALHNIPKH
jgi:hypothetical protein